MPECSAETKKYFDSLEEGLHSAIQVAEEARKLGLDPSEEIEIKPAKDLAGRVEGLVGPVGIAERIRNLEGEKTRSETAFAIAKEIINETAFKAEYYSNETQRKEILLEQAVRTGLALFTEGVVSAPIEGISKVSIRENKDGGSHAALYFAGPIRGAGGTGQAFAVLLTDYCRQLLEVGIYRASESEMERYVEEANLYAIRTRAGQYVPKDEEVRHIVTNCPVCITGEPTEDYDINVNKNTYNVETNRVRGGMCLVITEGICLKAAKILKIAKKEGLKWEWIEKFIKISKQASQKIEIAPIEKYMDEIVGGRPIFSYPMRAGGFRLRYGRTRFTGIASKAIHPASMIILDDFPAFGTQVKLERPGKGCIITPCNTIEGPIVKLKGGEVRQISTAEEAVGVRENVEKILFLGDVLVSFGDFLKANHPIIPAAFCEEWYVQMLSAKGINKSIKEAVEMKCDEAFSIATKNSLPLAPKFTYFWHDLSAEEIRDLAAYLATGKMIYEWFDFKGYKKEMKENEKGKAILEKLCLPHKVEGNQLVIEKETALALMKSLGMLRDGNLSSEKAEKAYAEGKNPMDMINEISEAKIEKKAGIYVGTSMGRPEKAKERMMKPSVHSLFPVGEWGGKTRGLVKALKSLKEKGNGKIESEVAIRICPACGRRMFGKKCPACNEKTEARRICIKCGKISGATEPVCLKCGAPTKGYELQVINFEEEFENACKKVGFKPEEVKGVQGLISAGKTPEALEKGILRAKHDLSVFRDGTCRFDATEIPATHFKPSESGVSIEKLKELGYSKDKDGKELVSENQVVELRVQDIIIAKYAGVYLLRVAKFIDDLLVYQYGKKPFYSIEKPEELIGKQMIAIAPHTSAGIVCRIIGISNIRGIIAHPYLHCACRRNCDGDELSYIMMLDALLNFSKLFLPETRGGQMDAPLVLTSVLDPEEIDDEAHAMDCTENYPLEFYEMAQKITSPSEMKIEIVSKRLGKESQYEKISYTHEADIEGPIETRYVQLTNMNEKVEQELELMNRIVAVDSQNAAERIILSHFFPDLYGNMRKFSKQRFRCVSCSAKYRRVPLQGKCTKCGGKIILTINKGGIMKYLEISKNLADKYDLPNYLKQRLALIEKEIDSVFENEKRKQFSLADYA